MPTANLTLLRLLLGQTYSYEVCAEIISETARLCKEEIADRWFFLLLNRVFVYIADHGEDLTDAEVVEPLLRSISKSAQFGVIAIEKSDNAGLLAAANDLTAAYSQLL
jgi:hypothetical protein